MSLSQPLTSYLISSCPHPLTRATSHPFLTLAGRGALPKSVVSQWLSQDRLYVHNYIRFIGLLLSKIRIPAHNPDAARSTAYTAERRAVEILVDALCNIRQELQLFEDTAREFDLDLTAVSPEDGIDVVSREEIASADSSDTARATSTTSNGADTGKYPSGPTVRFDTKERGTLSSTVGRGDPEKGCTIFFGPNRTTRAYIDLFMSAASPGVSLLEGMVVLWATETCYLRSWRYAKGFTDDPYIRQQDADGGALRTRFIPNWTSTEFAGFVRRIGDIVDELATLVKGAEEWELRRGQCLEWWRQVLWLEDRFWPTVEEE